MARDVDLVIRQKYIITSGLPVDREDTHYSTPPRAPCHILYAEDSMITHIQYIFYFTPVNAHDLPYDDSPCTQVGGCEKYSLTMFSQTRGGRRSTARVLRAGPATKPRTGT